MSEKPFAQLGRHRRGVVPADVEIAALLRPIVGEAGDDQMAAFGDRPPGQIDILPSVRRIGQEVEHRPVMPDIEGADIPNLGHIGRDPLDTPGPLAQPRPGLAQGGLGDIEHGDSLERKIQQPIDEHRGPAAHVDDAATGGRGHRTNQFQRQARLALIPANARRPFGRIDLFPMGLQVCLHHRSTRRPNLSPKAPTQPESWAEGETDGQPSLG